MNDASMDSTRAAQLQELLDVQQEALFAACEFAKRYPQSNQFPASMWTEPESK